MSFSGQTGAASGGAADPQFFYCHQCNHTVSITPSPSSDLICPNCNGEFLEECESPNPNPISNHDPFFGLPGNPHHEPGIPASLASSLAAMPLLFLSSSNDFRNPNPESQNRSLFSTGFNDPPEAFNPFMFLQNYINDLRADGANIQFVIENGPLGTDNTGGGGGFGLPANLGDYLIGPGLEQLIQQLTENDPNRYGPPPASKSAVESLPDIKISDEMLSSDLGQCAVCKDMFELGNIAKQMPCKHIYHPDCILPWLELHNSCPVCRYELPTDDPDYERRNQGGVENQTRVGGGSGSGGSTQPVPQTPRGGERRRFRVSLGWPFRAFGSSAETSGSGAGNNNNNNSGEGSNPRNRDFGSEPRQEDLD